MDSDRWLEDEVKSQQFEDVIIHFQLYTPEQIELARFWWSAGRDYMRSCSNADTK